MDSIEVTKVSTAVLVAGIAYFLTGTIGANVGGTFSLTSPLGGVRQSGLGRRYGNAGFEEYLEVKAIGRPA